MPLFCRHGAQGKFRSHLVAALLGSLAAVTCGGRSDLVVPGSSSGASTGLGGSAGSTGGGGGVGASGGAVGRGGAPGTGAAGGTLGFGGNSGIGGSGDFGGASGAGGGGCSPDLNFDPRNCGRCDYDCEGGACVNGVCQPMLLADKGNLGASALALDDGYVYWARPIERVSKNGGEPQLLSSEVVDGTWGIAVDSSYVFWGTPSFGSVRRVVKRSGVTEALTMENVGAHRLAADASGVYFTFDGVYHMRDDGSALRQLAPEGDTGIAIDEAFVYAASQAEHELYRLRKDGTGLTLLAAAPQVREVAAYGDFVFFAATGDGSIRRVPKIGGPVTRIGSAVAEGLAADADGVYIADSSTRAVLYLPINGFLNGASLVIAASRGSPRAIAVDAKSIYWTTDVPASGVFKVRKPLAIETFRR